MSSESARSEESDVEMSQVVPTEYKLSETGIVYDDYMKKHENPTKSHPEQPARVSRIFERLRDAFDIIPVTRVRKHSVTMYNRRVLWHVPIKEFEKSILSTVHEKEYLEALKEFTVMPLEQLVLASSKYNSIYMNEHSIACAYKSCNGVLSMAEAIMKNTVRNGLAIVRPPGHHAESHCAM
jgi:histone deacetylase 6